MIALTPSMNLPSSSLRPTFELTKRLIQFTGDGVHLLLKAPRDFFRRNLAGMLVTFVEAVHYRGVGGVKLFWSGEVRELT